MSFHDHDKISDFSLTFKLWHHNGVGSSRSLCHTQFRKTFPGFHLKMSLLWAHFLRSLRSVCECAWPNLNDYIPTDTSYIIIHMSRSHVYDWVTLCLWLSIKHVTLNVCPGSECCWNTSPSRCVTPDWCISISLPLSTHSMLTWHLWGGINLPVWEKGGEKINNSALATELIMAKGVGKMKS